MSSRGIISFLIIFTGACCDVQSQENKNCIAGIYHTMNDLVENRISHKINTGEEGYKFDFLFPADLRLTIQIVTPDSAYEFKPGAVYGYHQCGKKFRYYPGGDLMAQEDFYRIEETGGLVIYSSVFVSGEEIFYSLDIASPIHLLNVKNIEKDFPKHPEFVEAVKMLNKEGLYGDITHRDEKGNFIINRLYAEKIKERRNK